MAATLIRYDFEWVTVEVGTYNLVKTLLSA